MPEPTLLVADDHPLFRAAVIHVLREAMPQFRVLEAAKRPVSAVADQMEVREVASVKVATNRSISLELLFDPEYALDDRIVMEQFLT